MNDQHQRPLALSYLRFSSAEQVKDAKTSDQIRRAKEWADENGYQFSETSFSDLGVSAYKGDNSSIGDLARFLNAVEDGLIPRGSALVIEALDRLSRENQWRGQMLLGNILSNGVDVVTLNDGQKYTFEDLQQDMGVAIRIILAFNLAHLESQQKSRRVTAGWQRNLEQVREGTRLRSSAIPNWLKLVGTMDDGHFEVIEDRAVVTRELFSRFADGHTVWSVAKDFRDRGIKTPRGKIFAPGNIYRLVKSKAPFGILEIGRGTKNDRTVFDQIDDYFPRIVNEDVQRRVTMRLDGIAMRKEGNRIVNDPKRKTHGILTGVIRTTEGERCVCRKGTDGSFAYVETTTRRWLASRNVIESRFLDGWSEIVAAHDTDSGPEIDGAEAALMAAQEALEYAERKGSERLALAAQADLEEAERFLKEARRGQALAAQEVPEDIAGMEPWEANQWVRMIIDQVTVIRREKKRGPERKTMLVVTLKNGLKVRLGDTELMFAT
jgi:DNA invertase Pin-like site-specific DNA recombinase